MRTALQWGSTLEVLNDLGVVLQAGREEEAARTLFAACLAIDPDEPLARENLAESRGPVPPVISEAGPELALRLSAILHLTPEEVVARLYRLGPPVEIELPELGVSVEVRPGTADVRVIDDTFAGLYHRAPRDVTRAALIVDLGSNIGLTIADFAAAFPRARAIGVELDADNAALARRNVAPWADRCMVVQAAVAGSHRVVSYAREAGAEYGFHIVDEPAAGAAVPAGAERVWVAALTLDALLDDLAPQEPIDYLKVDVEGAEQEVFAHPGARASRTRCMKVEVHPPYEVQACQADLERLGFEVEADISHWSCLVARKVA